jgi:hypothetical protein
MTVDDVCGLDWAGSAIGGIQDDACAEDIMASNRDGF